MLQIDVLGDLRVASGGFTVDLHQRKLRELVCSLVVDAGEFVPVEVLEDRLWREARPATSRKLVHTYVSRLRGLTEQGGRSPIETSGSRYRLASTEVELDVDRYERLSERARASFERCDYADALTAFEDGGAVWRGKAYAEVADCVWVQPEAVRLEERLMLDRERAAATQLCLGRHSDVVAELQELVVRYPLRETFCVQLMTALYRSDRQADALGVFSRLRERLISELGVEPSMHARETERLVLTHDAELFAPCPQRAAADLASSQPGDS